MTTCWNRPACPDPGLTCVRRRPRPPCFEKKESAVRPEDMKFSREERVYSSLVAMWKTMRQWGLTRSLRIFKRNAAS